VDVLQPHYRDIPEQKDEKEEDQTGKDQKSDENSLLGFNFQKPLPLYCGMRPPAQRALRLGEIAECGTKK